MKVLSGIEISRQMRGEMSQTIQLLKQRGIQPCLALLMVGKDSASEAYFANAIKVAAQMDIKVVERRFSAHALTTGSVYLKDLLASVDEFNHRSDIHGILCQLPLPEGIQGVSSAEAAEVHLIGKIDIWKDVDCVNPHNLGLLASGGWAMPRQREVREEGAGLWPCTPAGVYELMIRSGIELAGKHVVVLGRSKVVGRPLSIIMSSKGVDATVTICHSKTQRLREICQLADILIVALGRQQFIDQSFVRPGAIVVDVGIHRSNDGKMVGDVNFESIAAVASAATPVPGGVGAMTVTMLMANLLKNPALAVG